MAIEMKDLVPMGSVPSRVPGRRPHIATVWRWVYKGCRGVKLETVVIGGRRFTSDDALQQFFQQTTASADGTHVPGRTARQRQRAIDAAERDLAEAGI